MRHVPAFEVQPPLGNDRYVKVSVPRPLPWGCMALAFLGNLLVFWLGYHLGHC